MARKEAAKAENRAKVKTQLERIKKADAPHPRLEPGDKVKVIINNKLEKGYMPDWRDEVYTVHSVSQGRNEAHLTHRSYQPIIVRQARYLLRDPKDILKI